LDAPTELLVPIVKTVEVGVVSFQYVEDVPKAAVVFNTPYFVLPSDA